MLVARNPSSSADSYFGTRPAASGFSTEFTANTIGAGLWGVETRGVNFSGFEIILTLTGGEDYGSGGGMETPHLVISRLVMNSSRMKRVWKLIT